MAYLSGNAVFIHGTRVADSAPKSCHLGLNSISEQYYLNFGTKVSEGGAISINCLDEITDPTHLDYAKNSNIDVDISDEDEPIVELLALQDIQDPTILYYPYFRSTSFTGVNF